MYARGDDGGKSWKVSCSAAEAVVHGRLSVAHRNNSTAYALGENCPIESDAAGLDWYHWRAFARPSCSRQAAQHCARRSRECGQVTCAQTCSDLSSAATSRLATTLTNPGACNYACLHATAQQTCSGQQQCRQWLGLPLWTYPSSFIYSIDTLQVIIFRCTMYEQPCWKR